MQRDLCEGGPEVELVALALTRMAVIDVGRDIHREGSSPTCAITYWTISVPLITLLRVWLEVDQVEYLFHRDFMSNPGEVNTGHAFLSGAGS